MSRKNYVWILCICFVFISVSLLVEQTVKGQSDDFVLEAEKHWETYRIGGTCISGAHNVFVGDIDKDNEVEIVTGGSTYDMLSNGTTAPREAPLRIWTWNSQSIMLEYEQNWSGTINCVYANDIDEDGKIELMISGTIRNQTGTFSSLKVCNYDGSSLSIKARVESISTSDVFVKDVDKDGVNEILSVGRFNVSGQYAGAKLNVWNLKENQLILKDSVEWCLSNVTSATSVYADDLDGDGKVEIITSGYAYFLKNSSGQLRIWQYDDVGLALKSSMEWQLKQDVYALTIAGGVQGNTMINSLKTADLNGDGTVEIVTGGFAYDGENINAQLRVWNWNGEALSLEISKEWVTDYLTEIKSLSLNDVDGDSKIEIITSGVVGTKGSFANTATEPERAELTVWNWDGAILTLKYSNDWTIDEGAFGWNLATGDVDKDGQVEIVTLGCTYFSNLCDPDMRIWSIQSSAGFPILYVAVAAAFIIAIMAGVLLFMMKRKNNYTK